MSNLIKSSSVISLEQLKRLQWSNPYAAAAVDPAQQGETDSWQPDQETIALRDQILSDAESFAEERLRETSQECERMLGEAEQQIDVWWLQKRSEDEAAFEASRAEGYELGFGEGSAEAVKQLQQSWESRLSEAAEVLKSAYSMREQIIQEAEPFLVELSVAIAEKIIGQQLASAPGMAVDLIRKSLSRRREQGVITLCVAPSQLAFVQASREELHTAIDSQAELHILPDSTVKDNGCVIRSAYGSIDARIDTQLSEIKRELFQLAHQRGEERSEPNDWE
ncbi:flagellar biosynthesis protein [Paenibacillus agaridevorans]|uniref:Flagellar biosynthesis protein n=1 Tax=Paenibacillus agaridevorans TaxID=171404 RepID=A0A2R5F0J1_9BACL|nr:FliH/SctL family protein [Paenibacillus agaridevorans]GBG09593.1 flagellar biosynthesis protein [Paenibacillus agaridevorans]